MTVNRLIALDMPAGQAFVERVQAAWESGDAVFPIDQRLPHAAKQRLIGQFKPAELVDSDGVQHIFSESSPTKSGDALVIATSGSTGTPKGVIHTHGSIDAYLAMTANRLGIDSSSHWLLCLPVSHVAGFSIVARSIKIGNPITIQPKFESALVEQAAKNGATHTSLVPTAFKRIDPSKFSCILLGGSAAPPDLPKNVITTYGMTETLGGIAYNGIPLDSVEIQIVSQQILLRSPSLFRGYLDSPSKIDEQGWYHTGDSGTFENENLNVFGRSDDMIITGGENVWPLAVEEIISKMPGISQVVVSGMPDDDWGQRVIAWATIDSDEVTLDVVRAFVKDQLPAYCAPTELRIVENFPLTSLGKIDIQALKGLK